MVEDRQRLGPVIAAIGAALLGTSVFLPWYAVSLTASGAASAQQALNSVAAQYGNTAFQIQAHTVGAQFGAFAGRQITTLSAHQAFKQLNVVLLILAAIALVAALARLASSQSSIAGSGEIAAIGLAAVVCVLFRMVVRPGAPEQILSLSLSWGIWMALASSAAILVGGLWPAGARDRPHAATTSGPSWDTLSGWTPEG